MRTMGWPLALVWMGCSTDDKVDAGTTAGLPMTQTEESPSTSTSTEPGDDDDDASGDDDDASGDGDDDDTWVDSGPGPTDTGGTDHPRDWVPPLFREDCIDGYEVTWPSAGLVAMSWDPPVYGSLDAPFEGDFDVYHLVAAESGAAQTNESFLLRLSSTANLTGLPLSGNCDDDFVVVDSDNLATPVAGTMQYAGTFHLAQGYNLVEARHYCELYRAGRCPEHHDPVTSCDSTNVNSVHLEGDAVCLVPAF